MTFFSSPIGQYVVQMIAHSMCVAIVVEALLGLWRVTIPSDRAHFRTLYVLIPLVAWPIYQLLDPDRGSPRFREQVAVMDTQPWLSLTLGGISGWVWMTVFIAVGVLLFFGRTLVPTGHRHLLGVLHREGTLAAPLVSKLQSSLQNLDNTTRPATRVVDIPWAVAYLNGLWRVSIAVSAPLVALLDEEELKAVLAHENAHYIHCDNLRSWLLLALGTLMFYNPVAMVALQRISLDLELACDDVAATREGRPLALASALIKTTRHNMSISMNPSRRSPASWMSRLETHVHRGLVARRVRRLSRYQPPQPTQLKWLKLSLTAVLSAALFFFVV